MAETPTPRPRRRPRETGTTGASDTPPNRSTAGPSDDGGAAGSVPRPPRATSGRKPALQKSLEELFSAPALAYSIAGDQWGVDHFTKNAEPLAEAWYKLSLESPPVARVLKRLTTGSAWGGVAVATGATVLPVLAHHNVLPFPLPFGEEAPSGPIVPPPPAPAGPPPAAPSPRGDAAGRDGDGMTTFRDAPPGVVTVAATNAAH